MATIDTGYRDDNDDEDDNEKGTGTQFAPPPEGSRRNIQAGGDTCNDQNHTVVHSNLDRHGRSVDSGLAERAREDERGGGGRRRAGWWKKTSDWILWGEVEDEGDREGEGEGGGVHTTESTDEVRGENEYAREVVMGESRNGEGIGVLIHPPMNGDEALPTAGNEGSEAGVDNRRRTIGLLDGESSIHEQDASLRQREFRSVESVLTQEVAGNEGLNKSSLAGAGSSRPLHGAWRAVKGNTQGLLLYVVGGENKQESSKT